MKLINDKITCMPGLTLFYFLLRKKNLSKNLSKRGSKGQRIVMTTACTATKQHPLLYLNFPMNIRKKKPSIFHILDKWS